MKALIFVCPATDQAIDPGIETDIFSLASARSASVRVHCPHCDKEHGFLVDDGRLEDAA